MMTAEEFACYMIGKYGSESSADHFNSLSEDPFIRDNVWREHLEFCKTHGIVRFEPRPELRGFYVFLTEKGRRVKDIINGVEEL